MICRLRLYWLGIIPLLLVVVTTCRKNTPHQPDPAPQNIEINLTYNGTATCDMFTTHPLYADLCNTGGECLKNRKIETNPTRLSNGEFLKFERIEPGSYKLFIEWDWNEDDIHDSNEPSIRPNPYLINVDGFEPVILNLEIVDNSSPNDLGKVSGTISYNNNNLSAYHKIYVAVQDFNYNTIAKQSFGFLSGSWILNPNTGTQFPLFYVCTDIPKGIYYRVFAWWDNNDNSEYDGGEPKGEAFSIYVSPGLETPKINIELKD